MNMVRNSLLVVLACATVELTHCCVYIPKESAIKVSAAIASSQADLAILKEAQEGGVMLS
jgi:hypothetical protein